MGLYKRGDTWWMRFSRGDQQIRQSTKVRDKKTAEKIYHSILGEIALGEGTVLPPPEEKTLGELFDRYLSEHSQPNKSQKSFIRDKGILTRFRNMIGDGTHLSSLTGNRIAQWKQERRQDKPSPATLNKELILLSHVFHLGSVWGWCDTNPCTRIPREKVRNTRERWLSNEEEETLLAVCAPWLQKIVLFAVNTGFRRGEFLDLTWDQIDLSRKTVTFWTQKNGQRDTLPLNNTALGILQEIKAHRSWKGQRVFLTSTGTPINPRNLSHSFERAVRKSGIDPVRFHDLRPTFATRLVHAGVDLYTVQRLGRWRTVSIVMRYAHHDVESLRSSMEAVLKIKKNRESRWIQGF